MARISVEWLLRLSCGFVNFYAGFYLLTDPARYYKFVPAWLNSAANSVASLDAYLRLQGLGELLIATVLWGWFFRREYVRIAAMVLTLEMMLILIFIGVDSVTFRNVGLAGAAAALTLTLSENEQAETKQRVDIGNTTASPLAPAEKRHFFRTATHEGKIDGIPANRNG